MLCVEFLVSLGKAVLTIVTMPFFGIVTNVMMLNSISILSSIFQVAAQCIARETKQFIVPPIISLVLIVSGYVLFILSYLLLKEDRGMNVWIGLAIVGTIFVSLNWWENYSTLFKSSFLNSICEDIARSRNVVSILSSLVRILVTAAVVGAYVPLSGRVWSSVTSVPGDVGLVILILVTILRSVPLVRGGGLQNARHAAKLPVTHVPGLVRCSGSVRCSCHYLLPEFK